jgi:hypothetical protein
MTGDELSFDNIISGDEIENLFLLDEDEQSSEDTIQ